MRRVVITGLGALTPIGETVDRYWDGLRTGKSGAAPITKFDTDKFKAKFACELKEYKATDHFDRKEVRKYDPFSQYALVASDEAVKDAGIDFDTLEDNTVTLRDRDTLEQVRVSIDEVAAIVKSKCDMTQLLA